MFKHRTNESQNDESKNCDTIEKLFKKRKKVVSSSSFRSLSMYIKSRLISVLINRVNNRIAVRQGANFHASIDATREHSSELVDLDLRHALAHVLEKATVFMFAGVEEEWGTHRCSERPDLNKQQSPEKRRNLDFKDWQTKFQFHLNVAIGWSRHENLFVWVHSQALNRVLVSLGKKIFLRNKRV